MQHYLYNGVELPALPEWDKTTYPYAVLWTRTVDSSGNLTTITVWVCNNPVIYDPETYKISSAAGANYCSIRKLYQHDGTEEEWDVYGEGTLSGNYATLGQKYGGYTDTLIWANHDVRDPKNNIVLPASDPIPVPEEPETPDLEWQGKDIYLCHNGQWVKCEAVRKMDGAWVKMDAYGV